MINITQKAEAFTYASFKERYYSHTNTLPEVSKHKYESVTGYSKFDLTYVSANTECIVEIKVRDIESNKYSTAMIEVEKYNYLLQQYEVTGQLPFYQCYYTDGQVLIFNLLDCEDIPTEFTKCPKHSSTSTKKYIPKPVKNLPISRAMKFFYTRPAEEKIKHLFYERYRVQ